MRGAACHRARCIAKCAVVVIALTSVGTFPAHAQDAFGDAFWQYRAAGGFDYSSGHYGAATTTDITFVSATLEASKGPWTLKAVVPWIRVVGPAVLLDSADSGVATDNTARVESGPGDIALSARYSLESLYRDGWFVDFTAKLKVPSASFAKGLGTGKPDGGVQIDVSKVLGKWMPFITAGYRFSGSPNGYDLRNIVYGTVGLQYTLSTRVVTGAFFDYRQAALRTAADPRELTGYINYKFAKSWAVNVYGVAGFSRNSPGGGGGIVLTYRWP